MNTTSSSLCSGTSECRKTGKINCGVTWFNFVGETYEYYDITDTGTSNVEEAPNDSAKILYKVIVENHETSIYPTIQIIQD